MIHAWFKGSSLVLKPPRLYLAQSSFCELPWNQLVADTPNRRSTSSSIICQTPLPVGLSGPRDWRYWFQGNSGRSKSIDKMVEYYSGTIEVEARKEPSVEGRSNGLQCITLTKNIYKSWHTWIALFMKHVLPRLLSPVTPICEAAYVAGR